MDHDEAQPSSVEQSQSGGVENSAEQMRDSAGWVYLMRNPSMPMLVKIGFSTLDPALRASELSSVTGIPEPFGVVAAVETPWAREAEAMVHRQLHHLRNAPNREFFRAEPGARMVTDEEWNERFRMEVRHAIERIGLQKERENLNKRQEQMEQRHCREGVEIALRLRRWPDDSASDGCNLVDREKKT